MAEDRFEPTTDFMTGDELRDLTGMSGALPDVIDTVSSEQYRWEAGRWRRFRRVRIA